MHGKSSPHPGEPKFILRTVIEDKQFNEQKQKITPDVRRLDEILFGITWTVARGPEECPRVLENPDIRVIQTNRFMDIPRLRIFFTFDDKEVHLKWVEVLEEAEDE